MRRLVTVVSILTLCGCQAPVPPIDYTTSTATPGRAQIDANDCQNIASQSDLVEGALVGAGVGALVGAASNKIFGGAGGITMGATGGAAIGVGQAALTRQDIMNNCMRARGYNVLVAR